MHHFPDSHQGPDNKHGCHQASSRASPPASASAVALQHYSSSGFLRFQSGICLSQLSVKEPTPTNGLRTELTCDTPDTTRHEPAKSADLTSVLDVVPVRGKHPFLRSWLASELRLREQVRLTEDSYDRNLMADSGRIFATDSPFPIQNPRIPFSTYILVTASVTAFIPNDLDTTARAGSGCRVIRNIFSRSNGAVQVRETGGQLIRGQEPKEMKDACLLQPRHQPAGISQRLNHRTKCDVPLPRGLLLVPLPLPQLAGSGSGQRAMAVR